MTVTNAIMRKWIMFQSAWYLSIATMRFFVIFPWKLYRVDFYNGNNLKTSLPLHNQTRNETINGWIELRPHGAATVVACALQNGSAEKNSLTMFSRIIFGIVLSQQSNLGQMHFLFKNLKRQIHTNCYLSTGPKWNNAGCAMRWCVDNPIYGDCG